MKILASMIRWSKTGNVVLVTITALVIITVVVWMGFFSGTAKAADEPGDTAGGAAVSQSGYTGKVPESAWGIGLLAAAASTGLSAIAAGIAVSVVGSAAMGAVAEKPEVMGRSIIFVGLAEGIAIYGLIISIMILGKLG
jgi:F0F1-type ATP synthase membrane subunit c/vacuolar-type H+-ATPase subunit K